MIKLLKNKLNKKIAIALTLVASIGIGCTLAYLTGFSDIVINTFSRASIDTDIEETTKADLTKMPVVVNNDVTDVLVRVRINVSSEFLEDMKTTVFEKYFGLAGIDDNYISESYKDHATSEYWKIEDSSADKYNCYYYYRKVLNGTDETENSPYKTEPLFDKILKNSNGTYNQFDFNNLTDDDKKILQYLNDIDITIYQESVPVTVTKDDGTKLNADKNNDGIIDNIEDANQIFEYFESNPADTESNN